MKRSNNSGFTLIEIIVVLIIVGILAAIALPNLFSNIAKSKGAEGMNALDAYKSVTESCVQGHQATAQNCTFAFLGLATASGSFTFNYSTAPASLSYAYALVAVDTGSTSTVDTITLTRAAGVGGTFTCSATGNFGDLC